MPSSRYDDTQFEQVHLDNDPQLLKMVAYEFKWDGALLDVYIFNTTIDDWGKLLEFIKSNNFQCDFKINDNSVELPASLHEIFEMRSRFSPGLSLDVNGLRLNSFFFRKEEIDFDIDPREISDVRAVKSLFQTLSNFAKLLNKDILITPEGMPNYPIFRILAATPTIEHRINNPVRGGPEALG